MNDQSLRAASKQSLPPEVQEGALLAGRYRIGRLLGSGGMGAVVAAEHVELNELVAIKVLLRDAAAQATPEALGRFTREAWAASKIKSEYVARVSDSGRLDDGTPYIVMEYLEGTDLEGLLHAHGQLAVEHAVELMLQACEALAEAHALGIFHRDLKPSNLFCIRRSDGVMAIKLLDFGISKIAPAAASFTDQRLTGTASTLGTPLYMSPEQMRSGRIADERSDIWSLGVILYEALLGRVPFEAENLADLAIRIATEKPAPITMERADVPAALEQAIMRCLDKESARRFQNVAELASALAPYGPPRAAAHAERAERILLTQSARSMPVITTTRSSTLSATGRGSHARLRSNYADTLSVKRRPKPIIAIAAAAAVVLAVVTAVALRRSSHSHTAARATSHTDETRSNAALTPPSAATRPAAADRLDSRDGKLSPSSTAARAGDVTPPSAAHTASGEAVDSRRTDGAGDHYPAGAAPSGTAARLPLSAAAPGEVTAPVRQPTAATPSQVTAPVRQPTAATASQVTAPVRQPTAATPQAASVSPATAQGQGQAAANKAPSAADATHTQRESANAATLQRASKASPPASEPQPAAARQKPGRTDKPSASAPKDSELDSLGGRL